MGTLKPSISKTSWPKRAVFCPIPEFYNMNNTYNDIKKIIIVVDISQHFLSKIERDITRERLRKHEKERMRDR